MQVNIDFTKRAIVHSAQSDWAETRMQGVSRRMLDRNGAEAGRATSIVKYVPDSKFAAHSHAGGEEFIVLKGVFQDEHGDYPVGSYVRNPPGTSHTPGSDEGCVIFVKLWQFDANDSNDVRIRFDKMPAVSAAGREGVAIKPLYQDERETVRIEEWAAGTEVEINDEGGVEILVLDGSFEEGGDSLVEESWLRMPIGSKVFAKAGEAGTRVWIKSGHLRFAPQQLLG